MQKKKISINEPLTNKPGQGRSKSTTSAQDRHLVQICKRNRTASSRQLASEWSISIGKSISASTTRRRLVSYGLKATPKSDVLIGTKFKQRKIGAKSMQFGRLRIGITSLLSFICFHLNENNQPFCFKPSGGGSVSVWGCFTAHGTGPLVFRWTPKC